MTIVRSAVPEHLRPVVLLAGMRKLVPADQIAQVLGLFVPPIDPASRRWAALCDALDAYDHAERVGAGHLTAARHQVDAAASAVLGLADPYPTQRTPSQHEGAPMTLDSLHHPATSDDGQTDPRPPATAPGPAEPLTAFVARQAPRLFALVDDGADHDDSPILAWGLDCRDHVNVVSPDGNLWASFSSIDRAHATYAFLAPSVEIVWRVPGRHE
ncbi:hypothetical protein CcI6DRAFT_01328 [Frankia sp. CcI6]|nr:hypothetical protein CcI6DRAFT_01328 [Frankia sp. CcI6]